MPYKKIKIKFTIATYAKLFIEFKFNIKQNFFFTLKKCFLLGYSCFTMLRQLLLHREVNQPYVYTYHLPFGFPSHPGHHRALSRVPCAIQQVLISFIGIFLTRENFCFDWLWKRTSSSSYNFTYLIIGIIFLRLASDSIYIKLCFSFSTTYFSVEHLNHITV